MITEIMYNPLGGSDYEYIEVKNIGNTALNLSDVRFTKGVDFDFPLNTMLDSGEFLLVVRNQATFESRYGTGLPIAGEWELGDNLGNGGEQLKLSLGAGTAVHDFIYLDLAPWPTSPDGPGYSLTLRDPASAPDHGLPENWRASASLHGSPGSDDTLTYAGWAAANFTAAELLDPAVSGVDADPDHDGLSNFAESYFGGHPMVADPSPGIPGSHDGFLSLTFTRRNGAPALISLELQKSSDLISWQADPQGGIVRTIDNGDGTETITIAGSEPLGTHPRLFLRLQLSSLE